MCALVRFAASLRREGGGRGELLRLWPKPSSPRVADEEEEEEDKLMGEKGGRPLLPAPPLLLLLLLLEIVVALLLLPALLGRARPGKRGAPAPESADERGVEVREK